MAFDKKSNSGGFRALMSGAMPTKKDLKKLNKASNAFNKAFEEARKAAAAPKSPVDDLSFTNPFETETK